MIATGKIKSILEKIVDKKNIYNNRRGQFKNKKYANILIGSLSQPNTTYILDSIPLESSHTGELIMTILVDTFAKFNLSRDRVLLLLADAAPYMKLAGEKMQTIFLKMCLIFFALPIFYTT